MSEHDSYYGYGENSIVELAESLKFQSQRLDQAKSWAAVIPDAERHIEAIKRRMLELLAPESPQDTDSTETMVEDMAKRMEEIQSEPQWMTNDRERDTLVENGFHSMSKPVGYGEVEVACEPLPETE